MKYLFGFSIILIAATISCNPKKQKVQQVLKFEEVVTFARTQIKDTLPCENDGLVHYFDYDFARLKAIKGTTVNTSDTLVMVCMKDEAVAEIQMISQIASFKFKIISAPDNNYHILYPSYSKWEPVYGFILVYNDTCYFIPYNRQPLCIMRLDAHLRVQETYRSLRFRTDSIAYRTIVNYDDRHHLYSETFYELKKKVVVDASTTMDELISLFNGTDVTDRTMELKIGIREEMAAFPLWWESGHHSFDNTIENTYSFPLDF